MTLGVPPRVMSHGQARLTSAFAPPPKNCAAVYNRQRCDKAHDRAKKRRKGTLAPGLATDVGLEPTTLALGGLRATIAPAGHE